MTTLYTEQQTLGDWLKQLGHTAEYHNNVVPLAASLGSGTVVAEVTATGKYVKVNTAASDGSETAKGILVNAVDATGVAATGSTGTSTTTGVDYTAIAVGLAGNDITVELVDPGANSSALAATVTGDIQNGYTVTVSLATGSGGSIETTSGDLAALLATATAGDTGLVLVSAADDGDDSTVLTVDSVTLTGGVEYEHTNNGVMMSNLAGCVIYFSRLDYSGTAATVQAALEAMGAVMAQETAEV